MNRIKINKKYGGKQPEICLDNSIFNKFYKEIKFNNINCNKEYKFNNNKKNYNKIFFWK